MENKITNVSAITYVLDNCSLPTEYVEKLETMRAQFAKKNSSKRELTDTQKENLELAANIVEYMTGRDKVSAKALANEFAISSQKLSPIMKRLVDDGKVLKTYEKKVPYFSVI